MAGSLNLRHVQFFVSVAELGSMTHAARELHVSQSAVSLAVSELERNLGVQLFLRRPARGLTLTAAGAAMLGQSRRLLDLAYEVETNARELGTLPTGILTIGCFTTLAPSILPGLLESFRGIHPQISVKIVDEDESVLTERVLDGTCELALIYETNVPPELDAVRLSAARPYAIVAPSHKLAGVQHTTVNAFSGEDMVLFNTPPSEHFYRKMFEETATEMSVRFQTHNFELVRSLVAHGFGFSILIQRPAIDVSHEGLPLVTIELDDVEPLGVVLVHAAGSNLTRRAQAFADHARHYLRTPGSPGLDEHDDPKSSPEHHNLKRV